MVILFWGACYDRSVMARRWRPQRRCHQYGVFRIPLRDRAKFDRLAQYP